MVPETRMLEDESWNSWAWACWIALRLWISMRRQQLLMRSCATLAEWEVCDTEQIPISIHLQLQTVYNRVSQLICRNHESPIVSSRTWRESWKLIAITSYQCVTHHSELSRRDRNLGYRESFVWVKNRGSHLEDVSRIYISKGPLSRRWF
jgi:hypothetical protein